MYKIVVVCTYILNLLTHWPPQALFQKVWTTSNIFGGLSDAEIKWNITPPKEFLPNEFGALNATLILINRLSPSPKRWSGICNTNKPPQHGQWDPRECGMQLETPPLLQERSKRAPWHPKPKLPNIAEGTTLQGGTYQNVTKTMDRDHIGKTNLPLQHPEDEAPTDSNPWHPHHPTQQPQTRYKQPHAKAMRFSATETYCTCKRSPWRLPTHELSTLRQLQN